MALVLILFVLDSHAHGRHDKRAASVASTGAVRVADRRAKARKLADPLTTKATRKLIDSRQGSITAAVEDLRTGQEWLWNPNARDQTASIMKVDILETLLRQAIQANTPLDTQTAGLAQTMIENSSDSAATSLWDQVGGPSAIGAYNHSAGLTQTQLNTQGFWGESLTSAADQILLLRQLVEGHSRLDSASQRYELGLMENIESDQDWGVSAGVPAGVSVALKNGWVPLTSYTDWEINSIGRIKGDGRDYLIAILTAHDPSQAYGISTIEGLSTLIWNDLAPSS